MWQVKQLPPNRLTTSANPRVRMVDPPGDTSSSKNSQSWAADPGSTCPASRRAVLPRDPTAYELHGDPAKVLAALALQPREARVLVIPSSVRAKERLRKSDVGHLVSAAQLAAETSGTAAPRTRRNRS
jgi:hypothetical protein